jgi:hypothetical protein
MVTGGVPEWVANHPALWGLGAGLMSALVGLALFGPVLLVVVVSVLFGAANWLLWRNGGPAVRLRAHLLERFPRNR